MAFHPNLAGSITVMVESLGYIVVPDSPSNTRAIWLRSDQREIARERMVNSGTSTASQVPWSRIRAKLQHIMTTPVTHMLVLVFCQYAWSNRAIAYFLLYLRDLQDASGNNLYSTYEVNVIPLGGYAFTIVASIVFNVVSDWKQWRWQIFLIIGTCQLVSSSVLAAWPSDHIMIMFFYFMTFMTEAAFPMVIAWIGDILRKEPETRAVIVGLCVTIVYVGHATIPLRARARSGKSGQDRRDAHHRQ